MVVIIIKPLSLCLVQMGKKGLELVKTHPKVLPDEVLSEITYKSMPMGAKSGDFSSAGIGSFYYSSYVFKLPQDEGRDNIGTIVAIFPNMDYDIDGIRKLFTVIVKELEGKAFLRMEIMKEILPNLYDGFSKGRINIKISSSTSISIDFSDENEEKVVDESKAFSDDLWK